MQLTNKYDLPLSMAVWLGTNEYDFINDPNYISVTTLIKPIRQLILSKRNTTEKIIDVTDLTASRMGTAFHASIENTWINKDDTWKIVLSQLGYSKKTLDRVKINPKKINTKNINVFLEQRSIKEINGYKVGGKFDFVGDGVLEDIKSTGCYSYMKGNNDQNYILQGSMYKWLNPKIITKDFMRINYIFTDWSKLRSMIEGKKGYPAQKVLAKKLVLMTVKETEIWIKNKLNLLTELLNSDQDDIPECTTEELWRNPTVFKYYKNPAKTVRATRNFNSYAEAHEYQQKQGGGGMIKEVPGQVRRCLYCDAFDICKQKNKYIEDGTLQIEET